MVFYILGKGPHALTVAKGLWASWLLLLVVCIIDVLPSNATNLSTHTMTTHFFVNHWDLPPRRWVFKQLSFYFFSIAFLIQLVIVFYMSTTRPLKM
jgi:hypothetical protein